MVVIRHACSNLHSEAMLARWTGVSGGHLQLPGCMSCHGSELAHKLTSSHRRTFVSTTELPPLAIKLLPCGVCGHCRELLDPIFEGVHGR